MKHFSILSIFLNLFLLFLKISLYKFFTSLMSWTSKNFFLESCYESNVLLIYFSVFIILAYRKVSVAIFLDDFKTYYCDTLFISFWSFLEGSVRYFRYYIMPYTNRDKLTPFFPICLTSVSISWLIIPEKI